MNTAIWTMGEVLVEIMRPQPDMPLAEAGEFLGPFPSGAPAIFIDTAARLKHPAGMIGGVGQDAFGACVRNRLRGDGVDVSYLGEYPDGSTAVAFVAYAGDGSRTFLYHIDGTPAVWAKCPREIQTAQAPAFFHVMGCSLMASEPFRLEIVKTVELFRGLGAKISFDPNIRAELLKNLDLNDVIGPVLSAASVLMPGAAELRLLAGKKAIEDCVKALWDSTPLEVIALKLGSQGATIFTRSESINVPAYAVKEVDPTGAGDCFDAAFLCGLLEGKSMRECGQMAAAAGALNAEAFGPMEGKISPQSVRDLMEKGKKD